MASSSLTVFINGKKQRKFGGVRSEVKSLKREYENMTYEDFVKLHPRVSEEYFKTLKLELKLNKN